MHRALFLVKLQSSFADRHSLPPAFGIPGFSGLAQSSPVQAATSAGCVCVCVWWVKAVVDGVYCRRSWPTDQSYRCVCFLSCRCAAIQANLQLVVYRYSRSTQNATIGCEFGGYLSAQSCSDTVAILENAVASYRAGSFATCEVSLGRCPGIRPSAVHDKAHTPRGRHAGWILG